MISNIFHTFKFLFLYTYNFRNEDKKASILRQYLENMGPVFIKLGQLASMHKYWLNNYQYSELSKLRDNVSIKNCFDNLKIPIGLQIDNKILSSGSIATVHLGKYQDETVVVKIKRNNIDIQINNTLFYIDYYVYFLQYIPFLNHLNLYQKFKEMKRILLTQIDFNQEIKNLLLFKKFYQKLVKIPQVYPEISNNDIIVMEYLPGIKTDEMLEKVTKDEKQIMNKILYGFLITSTNIKGLFHSDLHSGNFSWVKNEHEKIELILYDFGLVGRLTPDRLQILNQFYLNLINKDVNKIIESVNDIIIDKTDILVKDKDLFDFELKVILDQKIREKNVQVFGWINEIIYLINKYNLKLQNSFTDFELASIGFEGILNQLSAEDQNYVNFMKEILL